MNELVFEVTQDEDVGFIAECLAEGIITQGVTWDEMRRNVQAAVKSYFIDRPKPTQIKLHHTREEIVRPL